MMFVSYYKKLPIISQYIYIEIIQFQKCCVDVYLLLAQEQVQQSEELQNTFFSSCFTQTRVIHYKVRVDFSIVPSKVHSARSGIVFVDNFHTRHESCNPNVIMSMLWKQKFTWQFNFSCLLAKVA